MLVNKVTVVILTYNNFEHIEETVQSVIKQDYRNIEVIVQDDGSKNFDRERIEKCFEGSEGLLVGYHIVTNEVNLGTVKNFNNAVKKASGDIIMPLSCDDIFYDNTVVSEVVNTFEKEDCQLCFALRKGMDSGEIQPSESVIKEFYALSESEKLARICYSNFICGATLYYSKKFLEDMGGFDERFMLVEDYSIVIKALLKGTPIHFIDKITINYNETGVSQKTDEPKKVNPKFTTDVNNINKFLIMPNLDKIPSRGMRRYLAFRYYRKHAGIGKFKKLLYTVKYIDTVIAMKKAEKNSVNRFKELMR